MRHVTLVSRLAALPDCTGAANKRDECQNSPHADGMALWHRLVAHLAPYVNVVSVPGHYRDQVAFADRLGWQPLVTIQREDPTKRPYQAVMQRATLPGGTETLLVFGPAAQQPFATLTQEARQRVGRCVREVLHAR